MEEFKELLFKFVNFLSNKEWINKGKVRIGQIPIIPYFLRNQERAKKHWSPVCWLEGHFGEGDESIDINETNDTAFRTELCTIIECFNKFLNVFYCWSFS